MKASHGPSFWMASSASGHHTYIIQAENYIFTCVSFVNDGYVLSYFGHIYFLCELDSSVCLVEEIMKIP